MQLNFIAGAQRPAGDNPRVNSQICMTPGLLQGGRDVHVTHRCFRIDVGGSAATGPLDDGEAGLSDRDLLVDPVMF